MRRKRILTRLLEKRTHSEIGVEPQDPERVTEGYGVMQFFQACKAGQARDWDAGRPPARQSGGPGSGWLRAIPAPDGARSIAGSDRETGAPCSARAWASRQNTASTSSDSERESSRYARGMWDSFNARLDIFIEHQCLQSKGVRHRSYRQRTIGKLQELEDGEGG